MDHKVEFDPRKPLGEAIASLDRQQLCDLIAALCGQIRREAGAEGYRGGVYPDNISLSEEGEAALGPAKEADWQGQELSFLAPEVYWHGQKGPTADVYSLGLLLYYAVNGARLPFHKSGEEKAVQRRLSGEEFAAPKAAGRRLGEIISKATAFQASERYQTVEELKAVLETCIKNLYLNGAASAETVFQKNEEELSQVERMMVAILEKDEKPEQEPAAEEPEEENEGEAVVADAFREPPAPQDTAAGQETAKPDEKDLVYTLEEEMNPELEPVVISRPAKPTYQKSTERERKIAQEVKRRRRRPLLVAVVLCALLVLVAAIYKHYADEARPGLEPLPVVTPEAPTDVLTPQDTPAAVPETEPPVEETAEPAKTSTYQVFVENVSWVEARDRCRELGGHLVVINDQDEFNTVIQLTAPYDVPYVWVGCRRVEGELVWEAEGEVSYWPWDVGEPSYYDGYDGEAEDYLLLWNNDGRWVYNDSRNDPVGDYPSAYRGRIAYVCEFEG